MLRVLFHIKKGVSLMATLQELFGVSEAYRLPDKIMSALLSDDAEAVVRKVKDNINCDIRDMFQDEQGDRDKLKQDFTPDCICKLVAGLTVPGNFLDMCSGTGVLGKSVVQKNNVKIHAQEFSERTIPFALLDACVNGITGDISRADCLREQVFKTYQLEKHGDISVPRLSESKKAGIYDNIIMNPPYSMKFQDADAYEICGFTIPKSKADYGFVLRGIEHMREGGRLVAVLPHGVLFRGAGEGKIREWLIKEKYVNAVIGLPDKLFRNTGIPVFLLVLQKGSPDILFINSGKDFVKGSKQNDMSDDHIKRVLDAYHSRADVERYAHVACYDEIESNEFNLNIQRYVDTFIPEPLPDMDTILREMKELDRQIQDTSAELYRMLGELHGGEEDMKIVKRHREILRPKKEKCVLAGQMELTDFL